MENPGDLHYERVPVNPWVAFFRIPTGNTFTTWNCQKQK